MEVNKDRINEILWKFLGGGKLTVDAVQPLIKEMLELLPELANLAERVVKNHDEYKRDAERYRWLRNAAENADWEYLSYQNPRETDHWIDERIKP